jgi:hypothetical protein
MKEIAAAVLLVMGLTAVLCGGCVAGCSRSHFGTGGMAVEPGEDPMDNPRYVRLLQLENEGRTVRTCGVVVAVAAGCYLCFARRHVKLPAPNPDAPPESH